MGRALRRAPRVRGIRCLLAAGLCLGGSARGQTISGHVVDERGAPVARAEVQMLPDGHPVLTDTGGAFVVGPVRAGWDTVRVRRVGFEPTVVRIRVPFTAPRLTIVLTHAAATLDTVRTTGIEQRLPRMFERMRAGEGAALYGPTLDSVFARAGPRSILDALSVDRKFAFAIERAASADVCVFVNGISVNGPIEGYIRRDEISAIELNGSPNPAPEPFPFEHIVAGKWVDCGGPVILIWSRGYQQPPWQGH